MSRYQNLFAFRQLGYFQADKREFDVVCFICEFVNAQYHGPLALSRHTASYSILPLHVIFFTVWIKAV